MNDITSTEGLSNTIASESTRHLNYFSLGYLESDFIQVIVHN
jgi:hypothetical protein